MTKLPSLAADALTRARATRAGHLVAAVRKFSRFYTRRIGVLAEAYLESPFSVAEARVVYEIAHRQPVTATELRKEISLDQGYLSRILRRLQAMRMISRAASADDARRQLLALTKKGQAAFDQINTQSMRQIRAMLDALPVQEQQRVVTSMETIEALLGAQPEQHRVPYILRPPLLPGDMGWVVQRHGVLYAEEYGWNEKFEALVARIIADFVEHFDAKRERCWIAEREGENVGCVFLVKHSAEVAKLRLLLVEPKARGLGIGNRLVDECIRFARQAGYRRLRLWTNSVLTAARHIYESAGFVLVSEEPHNSFGKDLVAETWELPLQEWKTVAYTGRRKK
jgi:DNA-binding MarR family transcriptional regulator/N-acetylglutamate synthase-like GNAT family acetyltransferase